MGRSLTIQDHDEIRITRLKKYFGAPSKIAVLRMALALLDQERKKLEESKQWARASEAVRENSATTNKEMRKGSTVGKRVP